MMLPPGTPVAAEGSGESKGNGGCRGRRQGSGGCATSSTAATATSTGAARTKEFDWMMLYRPLNGEIPSLREEATDGGGGVRRGMAGHD